jgi:hypothetical protein
MLGASRLRVAPRRFAVADGEGLTVRSLGAARIASAGRASQDDLRTRSPRGVEHPGNDF